jgi:release factor glutamine methyltransferase
VTIGQLYRSVRDRFRLAGLPTPDLDARLLVSAALGLPLSELVFREHEEAASDAITLAEAHAHKRLAGMPVGRILGEREFYGRRFLLNQATLEPRPDTETLIDAVLERCTAEEAPVMCDIGTGTGAIAITLLAELPRSRMIAVDLSEQALECTAGNAALHGVGERLLTVRADYTSALRPEEGFDWVVSNPPYIRTAVLAELSREVIHHDPELALDGGEDGLTAYVRILTDAEKLLRSGGWIALEIGFDQGVDLKKQLRHHGFVEIEIIKDLAGNDRVVVARKS